MPSDFPTPGLKRRKRKSGPDAAYWVARPDLVRAGYQPETVRLPYRLDDPADLPLISTLCMKLQAEALEWSSGRKRDLSRFDGTIAGLSRKYQTDPASPFQALKHNTRRTDLHTLKVIEAAFGKRVLAALRIGDFRRWYDEAKKPKTAGGSERVRRAHGIIKKLREMLRYGVMAELAECKRLVDVLQHARFAQPARRSSRLEFHHVASLVAEALEIGRLSLALGTALQFETVMRQKDVIGEWEPIPRGEAASGIVLGGRRWVNGLTWADLADDRVLRKRTTKTGQFVAHDLKLCPLVSDLLDRVPGDRRVGPLIIDESCGRPYAEMAYTRQWRKAARAAGIPDNVWNMDARAGGITEADDAGANLDMIRSSAAHAQVSTTARYLRGAVGKSREVARLRTAFRGEKNGA